MHEAACLALSHHPIHTPIHHKALITLALRSLVSLQCTPVVAVIARVGTHTCARVPVCTPCQPSCSVGQAMCPMLGEWFTCLYLLAWGVANMPGHQCFRL